MRLNTVWLVVMLAFVILTAPLAANAQPSTKVHQIGFLWPGNPPSGRPGQLSRHSSRVCATWATLRGRTSPLRTAMRSTTPHGSPTSRRSWCGCTWTSS